MVQLQYAMGYELGNTATGTNGIEMHEFVKKLDGERRRLV